jgi:hypothetical protein
MSMPGALYELDGEFFVPSALTRGPWSPDAQHGGPPAALLARCLDRFENEGELFLARLTIELLRPVPLSPLTVTTQLTRPGRKVQLVAASLAAGATEVVRATALRIRIAAIELSPEAVVASPSPPGPAEGASSRSPWVAPRGQLAFHSDGVEHRFVAGGFDRPGAATDWIRLRVPVVADEDTLPVSRVAAAADFGNGVSWVMSRDAGYVFINPDLTIHLHRRPAGEWVCLEAITYAQPHGVGMAESRLWDERGPIGRSVQSLLLDRS